MLTDWIHWLSSQNPERLLYLLWGFLLTDSPRYVLSKILFCLWDFGERTWRWWHGHPDTEPFSYCPSVTVLIPGYNEAGVITSTLTSLWGTYPRLEIVVVDDGSTDGMGEVAQEFAATHPGVLVVRRPDRGGKPSSGNYGRLYATGEIIVSVDADSHLGPNAIWELVQPFKDPQVGGTGGALLVRNVFTSLCTWLQAYEYLNCIFIGRQLMSRLGLLSILSGAYGAYRREILERAGGSDPEPSEDMDLTMRCRRMGYKVVFVPYSQCFTNVPPTWERLTNQRLRWEDASVIRLYCRKHIELSFFWLPGFTVMNFLVWLDLIFFNVIALFIIWAWLGWLVMTIPLGQLFWILLTVYFSYLAFELVQMAVILLYSNNLKHDVMICLVLPLVFPYQTYLMLVRTWAIAGELFYRRSYEHPYIPDKVRRAQVRW